MNISILGCGWLGLPLAIRCVENNFLVNGTTTNEEKISELENNGINPYKIKLFEDNIEGNVKTFLLNQEILIVNIPPKLRGNSTENFVEKMKILIAEIEKSTIKKVLFISSTSVYNDNQGLVTEQTQPKPDTESGKQLLETEKILLQNNHFETTILRFGGLIGPNRHPIKMLAGKTEIENPDLPINLIHLTDCIAIILKIIQLNCWSQIFNAVCPKHISRKEYYSQKAIEYNLPQPVFKANNHFLGKKIISNKLQKELLYNFTEKI